VLEKVAMIGSQLSATEMEHLFHVERKESPYEPQKNELKAATSEQ
jgi:hypothetical protein